MKNELLKNRMNDSQKRLQEALEANGIDTSKKLTIDATAFREIFAEYQYEASMRALLNGNALEGLNESGGELTQSEKHEVKLSRDLSLTRNRERYFPLFRESYPVVRWEKKSISPNTVIWDLSALDYLSTVKYIG